MTKLFTLIAALAVIFGLFMLVSNARDSVTTPVETNSDEPARFGAPF